MVIAIVVGVYFVLLVFLLMFQSDLIYFPQREITFLPGTMGLSYEDVYFKTADGVNLHGWFVPAERGRGVVLFCHGNAGNISHRLESIQIFHRLGLDTFIFDYRGYGKSEGRISEEGTYLDVEAAWQYLVSNQKISDDKIIIWGRSLGGSIAAWIGQKHTAKLLILESVFTSVPDMGAEIYPFFPVRLLARFKYKTIDYVKQVNFPVLIIHSPEDEIIPFVHGRRLFEAAKEPKKFLEISGSHNEGFIFSGKHYENGLDSFITEYIEK
jgi:alpha-beta hydrolase superfamily lysophospholipase